MKQYFAIGQSGTTMAFPNGFSVTTCFDRDKISFIEDTIDIRVEKLNVGSLHIDYTRVDDSRLMAVTPREYAGLLSKVAKLEAGSPISSAEYSLRQYLKSLGKVF